VSWHPHLLLEISAMFAALVGKPMSHVEECIYQQRLVRRVRRDKTAHRRSERERRTRLSTRVVSVRFCGHCRSEFTLSALQAANLNRRALQRIGCSRRCTLLLNGKQNSTFRLVEIDGVVDTLSGWARRVSIKQQTLSSRIASGMSVEDAVRMPVAQKRAQ
jgi:hypothetical protein